MKSALTEADLARIKEAVAKAERTTSGEIVPYIVRRSGRYEVAVWRTAAIAALAAFTVLTLLALLYRGWSAHWWQDARFQTLVIAAAGAAAGGLVALVPWCRRLIAGKERMMMQVHRRAMAAFVEKEVFATRDRSGILLFVSLTEHRIEVVGDAGINAHVNRGEWAQVVRVIRDGIKTQTLADGLVEGITLCGELLHQSGLEIRPDDTNELSDEVTFES